MAKETRETEIVISGKDLYSPTADKVDRRIDGTAAKIKTLGKLGGFGGLGQVANAVEGFTDDGLGVIGKTAGVLAAVEIGGRTLKALGDGTRQVFADVQSGAKGVGQAIDENIINKIPVLGTAKQGLEAVFGDAGAYATGIGGIGKAITSVGDAWDTVTGKAEAAKQAMEIGETEKAVRARVATDKGYDATVAGVLQGGESPVVKIKREEEEALEKLRVLRNEREAKNGILSGERLKDYAAAQAVVRKEAADKLQAIDDKARADREKIDEDRIQRAKATEDRIATITAQSAAEVVSITVDTLRRQGNELEADYTAIKAKFDGERKEIAAERQRIIDNPSDAATDARARAAIAAREQALANAEGDEIIAAKGNDVARREATAERINKITRDTIESQIAGDDAAGQKALKRLDIIQRAADAEKEIAELLKDTSLTAAQRAVLEADRLGVSRGATQQIEALNQNKPETVQGRQFVAADDGRFTGGAQAARAQVEVFRDQTKHAAETAENTKQIAQGLKDLIQELMRGPVVG